VLSRNVISGNRRVENRSHQRIEIICLEFPLLPSEEEKREDGDHAKRWYFLFGGESSDY